jgi:predicted  nucleic acid-binding Zn-ribbon protein
MTGATIGITLAVFVVSVLVARWFNGKLDELEGRIKQAADALKAANEDRDKLRDRAVTAEGRLRSALTKVERLEAEAAELRASRERHADALAEQVEEYARLEAAPGGCFRCR